MKDSELVWRNDYRLVTICRGFNESETLKGRDPCHKKEGNARRKGKAKQADRNQAPKQAMT